MVKQKSTLDTINVPPKNTHFYYSGRTERIQLQIQKAVSPLPDISTHAVALPHYGIYSHQSSLAIVTKTSTTFHIGLESGI